MYSPISNLNPLPPKSQLTPSKDAYPECVFKDRESDTLDTASRASMPSLPSNDEECKFGFINTNGFESPFTNLGPTGDLKA